MAKSSIFSMTPLSIAQMKAFDVNGDGAVDMFDIAEIDLMINKSNDCASGHCFLLCLMIK